VREHPPYWRKVETLCLPGDEADVLTDAIARAVRRDDRLNPEEFSAKVCMAQRLQYGLDFCLIEGCPDCDEPAVGLF